MPRLLASCQENNIALRVVDIVVLNIEQLIYSIFLKSTEFNKQPDRTCKCLFNDKVLLPRHLRKLDHVASRIGTGKGEGILTYAFEQLEQISPRLVGDILRVDSRNWSHYITIYRLVWTVVVMVLVVGGHRRSAIHHVLAQLQSRIQPANFQES